MATQNLDGLGDGLGSSTALADPAYLDELARNSTDEDDGLDDRHQTVVAPVGYHHDIVKPPPGLDEVLATLPRGTPGPMPVVPPPELAPSSPDNVDAAFDEWAADERVQAPDSSASGTSTPDAYATATPDAYGMATPDAYGMAPADAYGTATPDAYGMAPADAYGTATPDAYGTSTPDAVAVMPSLRPSPWRWLAPALVVLGAAIAAYVVA